MQLPGRIAAAIEVLDEMSTRHRPAALALKDWGSRHRFAGSGDRAAIGNLVYDALRKRASHGYAMGSDSARALVLSVVVRDWGEEPIALNASFAGGKFAPDAITDDELARLTNTSPMDGASDHVRADVPEWFAPSLRRAFGENWVEEAQALAERPPLDMRVNSLKSERDRVLKSLKRFDPEIFDAMPNSLRVSAGKKNSRTPNVQSDEAYIKGWFEVQDMGSQLVAQFAGAKPGEQVLDLCAGAGGKSLALAAIMENKGQIFAYDADRSRLARIYDRLKRNGARNVQVRAPSDDALDDLVGKMDRVVVDAPCTGTGTWRRRPDTKWRVSEEQLNTRVAEQANILEDAKRFVRPGGHIVYITCSILPEENIDQVTAFLKENTDFTAALPEGINTSIFGEQDGAALVLTPYKSKTDGFFAAILTKMS